MTKRFCGLRCIGSVLLLLAQLAMTSSSRAQEQYRNESADSSPASIQQPQQGQPAPAATPPPASSPKPLPDKPVPEDQSDKDKDQKAGSKDRLFYAMPNFSTVESTQHLPPLAAGEKFKLVTRSAFDPFQFAWYGAISGISQATNSEPGYGQGWGAYGIRYASAFGDGLIESYMVGAVFPAALKQDPRYYELGRGSFLRRTGYALSRLVITRSDAGNTQFNASEIFGSALGAGISTYGYHPHEDKTLANTGKVWGTQVGYDGIAVVLKEFWPDLRRKFHDKKHAKDQN
jgi:hypothetical protein